LHSLDYFCSLSKLQNKELAEMLNIKPPQINSWKKGERKIPKKHLETLCDIFMIPSERAEIIERTNLDELDRAEIEFILNENRLKNALDEGGYMPEVIQHFEQAVTASKASVEIYELIKELKIIVTTKTILTRYNQKRFQEQLDKIRNLIEEFNKDIGVP
jgi:hypothetical protein